MADGWLIVAGVVAADLCVTAVVALLAVLFVKPLRPPEE